MVFPHHNYYFPSLEVGFQSDLQIFIITMEGIKFTLNLDRPFNGCKPGLDYALYLVPKSWNPEVRDHIEVNVKGYMIQEYVIEDVYVINPDFLVHDEEMMLKSIFGFDINWILNYLKETYKESRYYVIGCRSVVRISSPIFTNHGSEFPSNSTSATTRLPNKAPRNYSRSTK